MVFLVIVFKLEIKHPEPSSDPQLPLLLVLRQALLHVFAQFALLVTLIPQLADLRLIKGLAGRIWSSN